MIRYVGKATDAKQRLRQHLQPAQLDRYKSKKNSWIKSLKSEGLIPELVVLQEVSSENANKAERQWISCYRGYAGNLLTNGTEGGDGGAVTDPEAKARIRAARLGMKDSEETKTKRKTSQKKAFSSEEFRVKRRDIALELKLKPPANYGTSNNSTFLTEEDVIKLRTDASSGVSIKSLADQHNTSYTTIYRIVTGITWKNSPGPLWRFSTRKAR